MYTYYNYLHILYFDHASFMSKTNYQSIATWWLIAN